MAGLEEMWARFSLSEEEERGADVDGQEVTILHRLAGAARSKVPWQKQSNVKTKVQHDKGEKSKQAASTSGHDEVCEKEDRGDVSVVNGSTVGMVHACQQECEGTRSGLVGLGKDRVGPKEVQGSHVTASAKADKPTTVIDFSAEKSGPTLLTRAWKRLARDVGKNQKDNEEGGMLMTVSNTVDNGKRRMSIDLENSVESKKQYSTCEDVIKQSWEGESSPNIDWGFNRKITACQLNLKAWNRNCFGHVRNTLAKKLKDLKWAEEEGCYASNPGKIYQLREEIQKLKYREEMVQLMKRKDPLSLRSKVLLLENDTKSGNKDDFGLSICDAIFGTFIHDVNLIANASFSEVEAIVDSNIEQQ
nr:hypothetical protein CFP56_28365 [Quercus suber]